VDAIGVDGLDRWDKEAPVMTFRTDGSTTMQDSGSADANEMLLAKQMDRVNGMPAEMPLIDMPLTDKPLTGMSADITADTQSAVQADIEGSPAAHMQIDHVSLSHSAPSPLLGPISFRFCSRLLCNPDFPAYSFRSTLNSRISFTHC